MTYTARTDEPLVPTDKEAQMAGEASRILAAYMSTRTEPNIGIELKDDHRKSDHLVLSSAVIRMVQRILTEMAQGNAITVMPINAELTTQEAADFLNVSRPFVVKQLESGAIPFRKVGTHRRISVKDLLSYKREIDKARHQTLDELTAEAQRLGLGY